MNLSQLFETQWQLDQCIYDKHPLHPGEDRFSKKILALQVELGELANEWRGFKYWSTDQEPRTELFTWIDGTGRSVESRSDPRALIENGQFNAFRVKNPLLEEFVDCFHFILSIGNELHHSVSIEQKYLDFKPVDADIVWHFHWLISTFSDLWIYEQLEMNYGEIIKQFVYLGELLGFNEEQIEQAYYAKNKINIHRQEANY